MNDTEPPCDERSGSADEDRRRALEDAYYQQEAQIINGLRAIFSQIDELSTSLKSWSGSTRDLLLLEVKANVTAVAQIVVGGIVFALLAVLFVFSLCVAMGVVAYHLSAHLLLSMGVFLASLALVLATLIWWQKRLTHFLGFKNTTAQLQEGWSGFYNKVRPSDEDQTT